MKSRIRFGAGLALLAIAVTLVVWQGSFTFGDYGPTSPDQIYVFWGLSTLIFLLTVVLGFYLFRNAVKLYFERLGNREGSRIRTKIVLGALTLCFLPTVFLVVWSVEVLNRNLDKWFSRPAENIRLNLQAVGETLDREARTTGQALAHWVADSEATHKFLATGQRPADAFDQICGRNGVEEVYVLRPDGGQIMICEAAAPAAAGKGREIVSKAPIDGNGEVVLRTRVPLDMAASQEAIQKEVKDYDRLASSKKEMRRFYLQLLLLITLFVLFIATWLALYLARQISVPITALLDAAREVRAGNLYHRVTAPAIDEFATLVRAFNEMTADLETNRGELERRRRFIEAVLESIPTGVISLAHDGRILLVNGALHQIFPEPSIHAANNLSDLVPPDVHREFSHLMKRARRMGVASRQMEIKTLGRTHNISVTVSALEQRGTAGFVMVLEDTSELYHAQKMAAWHEVARRIAHELKNPLTPIALCSERIMRQLDKTTAPPEVKRILNECSTTIGREVESVKLLVDEFSQFARFPSANPQPGDLNEVVADGLAVFAGRLEGIEMHVDLARVLPRVLIDREQFKRVVVNLVDNAAEAMRETPLKRLAIATHAPSPDTVELVIADTGCGIQPEDKEKLFLPYFSTKRRGTGLGLAIVSHIVSEHHASIRVEDNQPAGARFIIEIPAFVAAEPESRPQETPA
jgi:two-component system nitrogen regulation sensor histidine kinase NtrY